MGFKSVLEITAAPEVISETYAFRMAAEVARERISSLEGIEEVSTRVPIMRFPAAMSDLPPAWDDAAQQGIRTLFRFPLRSELEDGHRDLLADRLLTLPVTSILFLKNLEHVEVVVDTARLQSGFSWHIRRERLQDNDWEQCAGLTESGVYRIRVEAESGETHDFLLAHDADVAIGPHRGGLDAYVWDGIEVSEVSVAALMKDGSPTQLSEAWRRFHVFLPTSEPCPYPLLVNGAFSSDLSRQEVRVGDGRHDYNRFLMHEAARLLRDQLFPQLERDGAPISDRLRLLDRGVPEPGAASSSGAAQALYEAMASELRDYPLLPADDGQLLPLGRTVVPPLVPEDDVGRAFRELLPADATFDGKAFPRAELCGIHAGSIAVDHGATELTPGDAAKVLGAADLSSVNLEAHPTAKVSVDPVLRVLQGLWEGLASGDRDELIESVRREPLFPVGQLDGAVLRQATEGIACFYPPRSLKGSVPLRRLSFLMQELCWGELGPAERNQVLRDEQVAWSALFEVREFKFPEVMRASVLPALDLTPDEDDLALRESLQRVGVLAAICQLAGKTPDPSRPLRYERLGTNRALFNLSRLRVPCRTAEGEEMVWRPAYQVYLGSDWVGEDSVELLLDAARNAGADVPKIPLLAPPELFDGLLDRFRHLEEATEDPGEGEGEDEDEDEVDLEEDEEAPTNDAERSRWLNFLCWIGVNPVLRPVHFHDVEDRGKGWLKTENLARPDGSYFREIPDEPALERIPGRRRETTREACRA